MVLSIALPIQFSEVQTSLFGLYHTSRAPQAKNLEEELVNYF